ncbi:MAG: hypothetical protein BGO21_14845 [Dyadobacter sp. 50-39]|nr:MAG: hypothetical protein BGO21_14845 [Dyadobacter sp. 50-39]
MGGRIRAIKSLQWPLNFYYKTLYKARYRAFAAYTNQFVALLVHWLLAGEEGGYRVSARGATRIGREA